MKNMKEFLIQNLNSAAPDLKRIIESDYDLGEVKQIQSCEIGDTNRNYRVECIKDGVSTWYFAKLFGVYKTAEKLQYESELYQYFAKRARGRLEGPTLIAAKNGDTAFVGVCKKSNTSHFFTVFAYLPGNSLDEEKWRSVMNDRYLHGFAQGLAAFHDFSYGYKPSFRVKEMTSLLEDMYIWERTLSDPEPLRQWERTQAYYAFYKENQEYVLKLFQRNRAVLVETIDSLPICISHGDCSPNNYMYRDETELTACGVCDFDWVKERPRIYDVCWMMSETLSEFNEEPGKTVFSPARIVQFIRDYNERIRQSPDFTPGILSKDELSVVPEIMQLTLIQMTVYDRFGYMLENNERCGNSDDNIGTTYWGLELIRAIERDRERIRSTLLNAF